MKSLLRIERVAVIRWSTLAFVAVLLFPLFFLRYGNTGAVVQSAMVMALPVTAAGLVFSHARVPSSYRSFSIHDRLLLRFSVKSLSLGVVINVCLTLLYGLAVGLVVNEPLSSRTILMLAFTAVVLSLACFVLRLYASPLVALERRRLLHRRRTYGEFRHVRGRADAVRRHTNHMGVERGEIRRLRDSGRRRHRRDKRMSAVQGGETCLTEAVYGCTVSDRNRPAASFLTVFRCGSEPAAFR